MSRPKPMKRSRLKTSEELKRENAKLTEAVEESVAWLRQCGANYRTLQARNKGTVLCRLA